jgi:predicted membrane chloride channel (bestrophin family)
MKTLKSIYLIINYKTIIVTVLSLISTWLCMRYNIVADFPLTLVGIAIVFPVVFSIDSAYDRRERALQQLSDFEAHLTALHIATRDWLTIEDKEYVSKFKGNLVALYASLREYFVDGSHDNNKELKISAKLKELSESVQELRRFDLPSGEMSRVNQYVSKILVDIENLKAIYVYRTPITLRAYSRVFIYSFPVLYGPYFVYASQHYSSGLEYMMPVLFSFILVSLDNIQQHLENPFDQIGEDDIKFDVERFEQSITQT